MSFTCAIDISVGSGIDNKAARISASGEAVIAVDVPLTLEQADEEVTLAFLTTDLTAGALVFINEGAAAVTIESNSTSVPDDTWTVAAGGFVHVQSLAAHITKLYLTNAGAAGNVFIRGVKDATP